MGEKWIDLHIHSNYSDGDYSIRQIIEKARDKGVETISITDHDSIDGVEEAIEIGNECGIQVVPGIELSTYFFEIETHILGYFINYKNKEFRDFLRQIRDKRVIRNEKIVKKLNSLGLNISLDELINSNKTGIIGRPHIARLMEEKGYISDFKEAFDRYLGEGKIAYHKKYHLPAEKGIKIIHKYGGLAVLAHPYTIPNYEYVIEMLIKERLDGIELHCTNLESLLNRFRRIVSYHPELLITGGSDFHGDRRERNSIGCYKIPYKIYEKLESKHEKNMRKKGKRRKAV